MTSAGGELLATMIFSGEDPEHGSAVGGGPSPDGGLRPLRALIVEDELLVAWHLETLLEDLGHEVCSIAPNAAAALRDFRALEPDVVFMDVNLGAGPGGVEAARSLRGERVVPIIFVTAYGNREIRLAIEEAAPGSVVVSKPVTATDLERAIEAALGSRH